MRPHQHVGATLTDCVFAPEWFSSLRCVSGSHCHVPAAALHVDLCPTPRGHQGCARRSSLGSSHQFTTQALMALGLKILQLGLRLGCFPSCVHSKVPATVLHANLPRWHFRCGPELLCFGSLPTPFSSNGSLVNLGLRREAVGDEPCSSASSSGLFFSIWVHLSPCWAQALGVLPTVLPGRLCDLGDVACTVSACCCALSCRSPAGLVLHVSEQTGTQHVRARPCLMFFRSVSRLGSSFSLPLVRSCLLCHLKLHFTARSFSVDVLLASSFSLLGSRRFASQNLSFVLLAAASTYLEVCYLGEPWHNFLIVVFSVVFSHDSTHFSVQHSMGGHVSFLGSVSRLPLVGSMVVWCTTAKMGKVPSRP